MPSYSDLQSRLLAQASCYDKLGYKVGIAKDKKFIATFATAVLDETPIDNSWNGISLVLDNIVCVDIDSHIIDVGWGHDLPPSVREKTPRGFHIYYGLPPLYSQYVSPLEPKIKWKPDIDLLVNRRNSKDKFKLKIKYNKDMDWGNHVICHPTPGYVRLYPDVMPKLNQLTPAPNWLLEALEEKQNE